MYTEARTAWMSLFNEDIAKVWSSEVDKLKNLAAVFYALKTEFNSLNKIIETEMDNYRKNVASKSTNKPKIGSATNCNTSLVFQKEKTPTPTTDVKNTFVTSPKITNRSKLLWTRKPKPSRLLEKENDIIDSSIVEVTPKVTPTKKRKPTKLLQNKSKKVALKNTTLTQLLGELPKQNQSDQKLEMNDLTNDTTYLDVEKSIEADIKQKPKMNINAGKNMIYANEPVRGKARKKLRGWSCKECQQFYEAMELSETQLLEKMNQCSRHRYKFKPPEDTPAFVWDVDISSSSDESQSSILFNFKNK